MKVCAVISLGQTASHATKLSVLHATCTLHHIAVALSIRDFEETKNIKNKIILIEPKKTELTINIYQTWRFIKHFDSCATWSFVCQCWKALKRLWSERIIYKYTTELLCLHIDIHIDICVCVCIYGSIAVKHEILDSCATLRLSVGERWSVSKVNRHTYIYRHHIHI